LGIEKIDLAFMDDIEQPCEVCGGSGFDPDVLQYTYNKKTIVQVMNMTVSEAIFFFKEESVLKNFDLLIQLGLDYLTLGQRLDSFSGGERQRLKLTRELKNTNQIIILDEPSTGLHPSDTQKLLTFFNGLVDQNNTLIVIEHNLDIISQADWIIDMGPGAGKFGGKVLFEGTPPELLKNKISFTAEFLKKHIQ
jgi:excinuclease UvrABC ATPase subunit